MINGFLVVRKAEMFNAYVDWPEGKVAISPSSVRNAFYGGILRDPWRSYSDALFSNEADGKVSPDLVSAFSSFEDKCAPFIPLCPDLTLALRFLNIAGEERSRDEIIAVRAPRMNALAAPFMASVPVTSRGFDVVIPGEWSLLAEGYFRAPDWFSGFSDVVNSHGLLSDKSALQEFVAVYEKGAGLGLVEPIPEIEDPAYGLYYPEILSVDVPSIN